MSTDCHILIERLAAKLKAGGMRLGTAESCTGGMLGEMLTGLPGSSEWYEGGIISYSNTVKERLLGVSADVLAAKGAVSLEVAEQMALGALAACGSDLAVSTTGIAGPDGGTPQKPVGTVCMAVAVRQDAGPRVISWREVFAGGREEVRRSACRSVLERLLADFV